MLPHVAGKILTSRPALKGERKQVTGLFSDPKGYMGLGGQASPTPDRGLAQGGPWGSGKPW
jgi:hypothetical protein